MNLDRLRAVQAEEREADSLRPLPDEFYREVADYIGALRDQRAAAAEAAGDPFGAEDVRRLTDEIETAEEVAEAIYERRVGKLVKRASLAAAGMPADEEGLTTEEAELFADLVAQIEANREELLAAFRVGGERDDPDGSGATAESSSRRRDEPPDDDGSDAGNTFDEEGTTTFDEGGTTNGGPSDADSEGTAGTRDTPPPDSSREDSPPRPPDETEPEEADAGVGDSSSGPEESIDGGELGRDVEHERVTLRITRDVGEVFGVDERVYELAAEDVVTLPTANARPLLDRDAAERVD